MIKKYSSKISNCHYQKIDDFQDRGHQIGESIGRNTGLFIKAVARILTVCTIGVFLFFMNLISSVFMGFFSTFKIKGRSL